LTGVGGGALMTLLLVFDFRVAPTTAVRTDLLFASITKGVGAWAHGARNWIDWVVLCIDGLVEWFHERASMMLRK
jgi:uncharacterized membrane protein YfcA